MITSENTYKMRLIFNRNIDRHQMLVTRSELLTERVLQKVQL